MTRFYQTGLLLTVMLPSLCLATFSDVRINKDQDKLLKQFTFIDDPTDASFQPHTLISVRTIEDSTNRYVRYQQYYQGIKVIGRSVIAHHPKNAPNSKEIEFTGKLAKGLSLDLEPSYLSDDYRTTMVELAQQNYQELQSLNTQSTMSEVNSQPIIWIDKEERESNICLYR